MFEKKTELKAQLNLAIQELLSCEAKIRDIMTKSRVGILVVDHEGATRFANSFAAAIFDCTVEELLGYQFTSQIDLDATKEVKLKSRSGRTMTAETWEIEIEWEGKPAYLVFLHDVTERVQKEQELRKLYRAITESPSIVMITDANGVIEYVNPAFERALGRSEASVLGNELIRYVLPDDLAKFIRSFDTTQAPAMVRLLKRERGEVPVKIGRAA